jgi:hypothetical protein
VLNFMPRRGGVAPACPKCQFAMSIDKYVSTFEACRCDPLQADEHLEVRCVGCGYTVPMRTADAKVDS